MGCYRFFFGGLINSLFMQVFSMLPGFSSELMPKGREKESQAKIKRYMTMMDSMTNEGKH
jgi:signal recognition particle GTPase